VSKTIGRVGTKAEARVVVIATVTESTVAVEATLRLGVGTTEVVVGVVVLSRNELRMSMMS